MEEKSPIRSAMVSRLPKFGGRSSTSGTIPLSNGSSQPTTPTQDGKTTPLGTCPNGVIRTSPFSLKWKRDEKTKTTSLSSPSTPTSTGDGSCEDKTTQIQFSSSGKELKNSSPGTLKMRRSGSLMVAVSTPKVIPKQSLKMSPKVETKLGPSPLNGGPKMGQNGSSIPARPGSESRLVRPRLGSPRSSSQDSLCHSSDSLKNLAMDNMVRSNSFTHFKQIPSPTNQPMTRSFSFNRAVELAKPLANTQLQPPRSSFLKPPQLSNGRVGLGLGTFNGILGGTGGLGGGHGGLKYSRTSPAASSSPNPSATPAPSTPSALKKPLIPSCVLNKTLGSSGGPLGYRLPRPGQAKQKPLLPGLVNRDIKPSTTPEGVIDTESTSEAHSGPHSDSDGSSGTREKREGGNVLRQHSSQGAGEAVEDMSFSSASSLDRGDISEEFLDDFDSMGDILIDGDLPYNGETGSAQNCLRSFLSETMDWGTVDLMGHKDESSMQESQVPLVLSPEGGDVPQGSSLEISPSNSSGGTYMWDEEGLEPLGGPGTHPCDSYDDSELNSMDILNNLDPLGTGELDEDDLMLDVDLPEDGLHGSSEFSEWTRLSAPLLCDDTQDTDRMSHIEHLERGSRQGQRRKQHRWNGPDHFQSDSRVPIFQHYDGFRAPRISPRPVACEVRQDGYMGTLDELTLKHMAQDCSSLKNQLLRLKTLLQLEDAGSPVDVTEGSEDNPTALQLEELMKEVHVLREELRSRDKTIAQLTLQCQQLQQQQQQQKQQHEQMPTQGRQVRCQCNHQRAPTSLRHSDRQLDRRPHQRYDKATQTYWRAPTHAGVLPISLLSPWQAQHQGLTRVSMPQRRQTSNTTAFQPQSQRAPLPGKTNKNSPHRGPQ
ncbi:hypothetical protein LDENG_00247790 [Lucifuga dentata]|nr:hypothetical protein LDENG_00247790 [Lucifuga dentata]